MINPLYLRTLATLVETKHFTRTAELLNMTQPGVSQHIKKLEEQLGKELLNRFGKQFELTEAGERVIQFARQQALEEQRLIDSLEEEGRYSGECRVSCSGAIALRLLPKLLELQQQHSGLSFQLEAAPNSGIIRRIQSNECELGIITQSLNDPSFSLAELGEDELCLVVPAGAEANWDSLMQLGFINHPDGHHYGNQLLGANFADHFTGMQQIPQAGCINQLGQILLPVSMGIGFTVLPKSAVAAFPYPTQITIARLSKQVTETIYLVHKKHRPLGKRYELVKEILNQLWN